MPRVSTVTSFARVPSTRAIPSAWGNCASPKTQRDPESLIVWRIAPNDRAPGTRSGFTVSAPFVILFLGQFILPALHVHEKRFLFKVAGWATFLFLLGFLGLGIQFYFASARIL